MELQDQITKEIVEETIRKAETIAKHNIDIIGVDRMEEAIRGATSLKLEIPGEKSTITVFKTSAAKRIISIGVKDEIKDYDGSIPTWKILEIAYRRVHNALTDMLARQLAKSYVCTQIDQGVFGEFAKEYVGVEGVELDLVDGLDLIEVGEIKSHLKGPASITVQFEEKGESNRRHRIKLDSGSAKDLSLLLTRRVKSFGEVNDLVEAFEKKENEQSE